jgi:PTH1 family peptidyl-tRNA hydrolase
MAIDECITQALGSLDVLIDGPMERAMMKIHARPAQPKPAAPARPPTLSAVASAMAKGPELPAGAPSSPAAAGHLATPPAGDRPD